MHFLLCLGWVAAVSAANVSCTMSMLQENLLTEGRILFEEIDMLVGYDHMPQTLEVQFTIMAPTSGWVGFGISELGSMKGSDMVIVEPSDTGFQVTDRFSTDFVRPAVDKLQHWKVVSVEHLHMGAKCSGSSGSITRAVVRRLMDTCDKEDYQLTPDYMQNYFIAAYAIGAQRELSYHGLHRQSKHHYLHVPQPMVPKVAKGPQIAVWSPAFNVPAGKSNYCYSKLKINVTAYITAFSVLDTHKLHHLSLHKAAFDSANWKGDSICDHGTGVMGIPHVYWALGAGEQLLPYGLFMKVEPGEYFFEAHFENPDRQPFTANTGFRIWVHDQESLQTLEEENEIQPIKIDSRWTWQLPARAPHVEASFELPTQCLEELPQDGISVLVTVAHMHEAGKSLAVFRTRGDRTDKVFEHQHYDFNRQGPIWKSWHLLRGDIITWTCTWNMSTFSDPRVFGTASADEMCQIVLFTNKGMPFRISISGIEADGANYAYCGNAKVGTPCTNNCASIIASPPNGSKVMKMNAHPAAELLGERGPRREVCRAFGVAEVSGPPNNWMHRSQFLYLVGLWAVYSLFRRIIVLKLSQQNVEKPHTWTVKRAINVLEGVVGVLVGLLVFTGPGYFAAEIDTRYDMSNGEPIGHKYYALNMAADLTGAFYMIVLAIKAGSTLPIMGDLFHHGPSIFVIAMLRQAFEYEFAPQLYAVFSACLLTHVVAAFPVLFAFSLFKLSTVPQLRRRLSWAIIMGAIVKMGIQVIAHILSIVNYVAMYDAASFWARDKSSTEWSKASYRAEWPSYQDLLVKMDWTGVLKVILPPVWIMLFTAQVHNLRFQIIIARAGLNDTYSTFVEEKTAIQIKPAHEYPQKEASSSKLEV